MPYATTNIDKTAPRRLRRIAAAVVVLGGLASAAILHASPDAVDAIDVIGRGTIAEKRELSELEHLGGQGALLLFRFQQWFESLWHGQRLGVTVAVLTVIAACLCLHFAALAEEEVGR